MNDTTTPRTDDQSVRYYDDATGTRIKYVAAKFACQLERELTQRKRERDEAREGWADEIRKGQAELRNAEQLYNEAIRERDEAREYADKLVAHKDMVCLPKDLEVLREANLGLAVELNEAQNEIIGWKNKWDCAIDMTARAENALDEMTLRWERTNDALFDERALADRLGTELEIALSRPCPRSGESIKALTAWKEARK